MPNIPIIIYIKELRTNPISTNNFKLIFPRIKPDKNKPKEYVIKNILSTYPSRV